MRGLHESAACAAINCASATEARRAATLSARLPASGFFNGAALSDPAAMLEGAGKRMRHVKLKPGAAVDEGALSALIDAAYADIRLRLAR